MKMFTLSIAPEVPNSRSSARMVRHTARCSRCGAVSSIVGRSSFVKTDSADQYNGLRPAIVTAEGALLMKNARVACSCGNEWAKVVAVKGTVRPDHKCDARCLNSKGHVCDCSCGGKNHGAGFAA